MLLHLISLLLLWQTPAVPYRAKDDYKVELKYDIKDRPVTNKGTVNWEAHNVEGRDDRARTGKLPFITVHIKILNPKADERRVRGEDSHGSTLFNQKIGKADYEFDMGYVDDIKDKITANVYTVYTLDADRKSVNRIELLVQDDGTFLVNGEKRGKF